MIVEQSRKDLLIISQGQGIGNFYGLRRKPITTVAVQRCTLSPNKHESFSLTATGLFLLKGKTVTKVYYVSMQKKKFPDTVCNENVNLL